MDVQQPKGLAWTYFANHDYSAIQCWVCATFLSPSTINQTRSLHIIMLSLSMMQWTTHLWASLVLNFSSAAFSFVITAYLALQIILI